MTSDRLASISSAAASRMRRAVESCRVGMGRGDTTDIAAERGLICRQSEEFVTGVIDL